MKSGSEPKVYITLISVAHLPANQSFHTLATNEADEL